MPTPVPDDPSHQLLTPFQVAEMFAVDPKTVTRWANAGRLRSMKTLGGHRRYHLQEVLRVLKEMGDDRGLHVADAVAGADTAARTAELPQP